MQHLTADQQKHLRSVLLARQVQLGEEVRDGTERRSHEDSVVEQAGEVPDAGDTSVALEVNDLRNAEIARDVGELRGIDVALARMDSGDYGVCTTCECEIPLARLVASPTAERCIRCQTLFEAQHDMPRGGSM